MTTTSAMQTVPQSKTYYVKENYYQKNSEKGYFHSNSNNLLEHLGLSHNLEINEELHFKLIEGYNPKTDEALMNNAGKKDRRAGFDMTTSAPKSFSILNEYAKIKGDEDLENFLLAMQKEANLRMMQEASKYALTRLSDEKKEVALNSAKQDERKREIEILQRKVF